MKRLLSILTVIALVSFAAQAQAAGMYAGVKGGVNIANVGGDDAGDTSSRTGFQGGLFIGKHVNDQFGFRVEGLYVQKGAKADVEVTPGNTVEVTSKLDYIEFPILFVYDLTHSETMGFNLFAGPTLGFNMTAKAEADGGESTDIDNIKSFEFGAAIGAGLEKKMASGKAIGLDVRYSLGATSILEDVTVGSTTTSPSIKNHGIGIMASFSVPIGGSSAQ
jgi:opacity protein-like surface antigen